MDKLRSIFDNAGSAIGRMSATQKLLIGSLVVIASMTLFLVSQYAATPARVELMSDTGDTAALSTLRSAGIDADVVNGAIQVPPNQRTSALAVLSQSGQLPGNTALMFQNLIQSQDWKASREQHRQQYTIALQNELSAVISRFRNVSQASVILDVPQRSGLGRAAKNPTASITIFGSGGPIGQDIVDAAGGLVMGAVSGLNPASIQVVDGTTGAPRRVSDADSRMSSKAMDAANEYEQTKKLQIMEMLSHIPDVKVSVSAVIDVTRVASKERVYSPEAQGSVSMLKVQRGADDKTEQMQRAAEAGVRSNQTASINTGSGSGTLSEASEKDVEFENGMGYIDREIVDPRGTPTYIRASIVVPEEYISELLSKRAAAAAGEGEEPELPTLTDIQEYFEGGNGFGMKSIIEQQVGPHLIGQGPDGSMIPGEVVVTMSPFGDAYRAAGQVQTAGFLGTLAGGGGVGMIGNGNLVETVLVGILSLVAVFMMFTMVKRSSKKLTMPSAEELVGVPPQLERAEELIGEADEMESAITGIEVDDAMVQIQKLREQVGDLITSDPEAAAQMVERWVEVEE